MRTPFASALSTDADGDAAMAEVADSVSAQLAAPPDLAALFVSAHHAEAAPSLLNKLCDRLGSENVIGCTAESIAGIGKEVEMEPAVSLWAARLPNTTVLPMQLEFIRTAEGGSIVGWPDHLPQTWPEGSALIALGDPFSFPPELLLERVNEDQPGVPVIGGMASAGSQPGMNRLFLGRRSLQEGAVAALVHGGVTVRTVVSQGCRPIGKPFVITKAERNVIQELGGATAYRRLVEVFNTLPTHEQEMLQRGLHVGRVVSEYQDHFEQGDFLVRNVMGVDEENGAIVIGDFVKPGQTVQFHLRDAATADAELRQLLSRLQTPSDQPPRGVLMFTCNGRGTRLFDAPDHDAGAVSEAFGHIPLAGFFAAGEIGPVGGKNFLHGFTASLAVFEPNPSSPL